MWCVCIDTHLCVFFFARECSWRISVIFSPDQRFFSRYGCCLLIGIHTLCSNMCRLATTFVVVFSVFVAIFTLQYFHLILLSLNSMAFLLCLCIWGMSHTFVIINLCALHPGLLFRSVRLLMWLFQLALFSSLSMCDGVFSVSFNRFIFCLIASDVDQTC